jgi:hypothetical protein
LAVGIHADDDVQPVARLGDRIHGDEGVGADATATFKIVINGKAFEVVERFRIDREAKTVTYEALEVNGKRQDLQAGRVFLVDLTAQAPTLEQRAVDLSGPAATVTPDSVAIEAATIRARDKVTQKDEAAREFVGQMK